MHYNFTGKYLKAIDSFVKLRVYSADKIKDLLRTGTYRNSDHTAQTFLLSHVLFWLSP